MGAPPNVCSVRLFGVQPAGAVRSALTQESTVYSGPPLKKQGLHTLVAGYVVASVRENAVNVAPLARPSPNDVETLSECPFVKLRVSGDTPQLEKSDDGEICEGLHIRARGETEPVTAPLGAPIWMDSDRQVVLPAAHAAALAMVPTTWLVDPRDTVRLTGTVWDVWVFVKICRWGMSWPTGLPILTETFQDARPGPTPPLVRPRAARSITISATPPPQTWGMSTGGVVFGELIVPGGEVGVFDNLPAFDELLPPTGGQQRFRSVAWGIQP